MNPLGAAGAEAAELDDAGVVEACERVDGGLGGFFAEEDALGHLDGVHDHDQGAALHLFFLGRVEPDGECVLDGCAHPRAGAEAVGPPHHDEPAADVVDVAPHGLHLRQREGVGGDVVEDDGVVAGELGERLGALLGRAELGGDACVGEQFDELLGLGAVGCEDEDLALAADEGDGHGAVVVRDGVGVGVVGLEAGLELLRAGTLHRDGDGVDVGPALDQHRHAHGARVGIEVDLLAVAGEVDRARDVGGAGDAHAEVDGLAHAGGGGDDDVLDDGLGGVAVDDRENVDGNTEDLGGLGGFEQVADGFAAVADEQDAVAGVAGAYGQGELYRGGEVGGGGLADIEAFDAGVVPAGQPLNVGVLGDGDDADLVLALAVLLDDLGDVAIVGELFAGWDGVADVGEDVDGDFFGAVAAAGLGHRQAEQQHDDQSDEKRGASCPGREPGDGLPSDPDDQGPSDGDEPQPPGRVELDRADRERCGCEKRIE